MDQHEEYQRKVQHVAIPNFQYFTKVKVEYLLVYLDVEIAAGGSGNQPKNNVIRIL